MRLAAKPIKGFLVLAMVTLFSGCATTYNFKVDAISNPSAEPGVSYKVINRNADGGKSDLRSQEAAEYVKTALSGKGLYEADSADEADMIVEFEYGMEEPRTKVSKISTPVYIDVPGAVRYVQTPVKDKDGNVKMVTVAVPEPSTRQYAGQQESVIVQTIYEKYMRITARENDPEQDGDNQGEQMWSVYVTNEDERDDLRQYLPVMVSAAVDFIGENSETQQTVKLKDTDEVVTFVKKGL